MLHGLALWVVKQLWSPAVVLQYNLPLCFRSAAETANKRLSRCSSFQASSGSFSKHLLGAAASGDFWWVAAAGQSQEVFASVSSYRQLLLATFWLWTTYAYCLQLARWSSIKNPSAWEAAVELVQRVQLPEPRKQAAKTDLAVVTAVSARTAQWGTENQLRTMWDLS